MKVHSGMKMTEEAWAECEKRVNNYEKLIEVVNQLVNSQSYTRIDQDMAEMAARALFKELGEDFR